METTSNSSKLAVFVKWLNDNGADISQIELRDAGADGNGVYTLKEINANQPYAYIPHNLAITGKVCQAILSSPEQAGDCGLTGRALLSAFLIHERYVSANSFWKPYIDILPADVEMQLLRGTPVEFAVEERREKYAAEHRLAVNAVAGKVPENILTFENYMWAASVVSSRSFPKALVQGYEQHTSSIEVLLPLLDMLNHLPKRKVSWVSTNDGVEFVTGAVMEKGDQVFNNYGPKSNEELMVGYGFYERELLVAAGIDSCDHFIQAGELPHDLLPMLRVMAMSDVDVYYAHRRLKAGMWEVRPSLQYIGMHNELCARYLLVFLLQKKLQVFEDAKAPVDDDKDNKKEGEGEEEKDEKDSEKPILRSTIARLMTDEESLIHFACHLPHTSQSLPWYAHDSECTSPESTQPAKRLRSNPLTSDELQDKFLSRVLITPESFAQDIEFADALSQVDIEEDVTIVLFVLRALALPESPWHAAAARLRTFRHPMLMFEEDPQVIESYGEMMMEMGKIYDSLFPLLTEHFPEVFPVEAFTSEKFIWAAGVVETFRLDVHIRGEDACAVEGVCLI
ncbi:hypothetical protein BX661DRAFT_184000 [Kickxella alabastrina]|uniref:uncharacterized protein n=1 Tax=Kickxella alabastrina TaxID=61397 RepID=UPI00221F2208|nr:uncharacterized protein BX661DRAFT_184000 [Kickxella alabastrina]KAI7826420.1 hypothetical protein BX661DRAFT_184000 [Kickxella alabastrina]